MAASHTREVVREIAASIEAAGMPGDARPVVAAISGGADSVCLLHALVELGYRPRVAHLDHGIRAEAADDAAFVRDLASSLGLECVLDRGDAPAYAKRRRLSLEAAARELRYAFLSEASQGHEGLFLAHTADDQIETFLLRLIRGAGAAGLSAMRPIEERRDLGLLLCRPMLSLWRTDVERYLRSRQVSWREDASNRDRRFLRNRVRHELLPLLLSMNPGIKHVLLREAATLGQQHQHVEAELLRQLGLQGRQIAAALRGEAVVLRGGRRLDSRRLWTDLLGESPTELPPKFDVELPVPGVAEVPDVGTVEADLLQLQAPARAPHGSGSDRSTEIIDAAAVSGGLRVRSWKPGDRFIPLGMKDPRKLQDFFVDSHVPRSQRGRIPLVVDAGSIVWVAGMRMDERFKIAPTTRTAIRLRFVPVDGGS